MVAVRRYFTAATKIRRPLGTMQQEHDIELAIGKAVNVLSDRWSIMLIRDLLSGDGERRFQDFLDMHRGLSLSTVSTHLKLLEKEGVVIRSSDKIHWRHVGYRLTKKGKDLLLIIREMNRWDKKDN